MGARDLVEEVIELQRQVNRLDQVGLALTVGPPEKVKSGRRLPIQGLDVAGRPCRRVVRWRLRQARLLGVAHGWSVKARWGFS